MSRFKKRNKQFREPQSVNICQYFLNQVFIMFQYILSNSYDILYSPTSILFPISHNIIIIFLLNVKLFHFNFYVENFAMEKL